MAQRPAAVLFTCNLNRVRSPMAAALLRRHWRGQVHIDSCGLEASAEPDPFAVAVMGEIGLDLSGHVPKTFDTLEDGSFDVVVSLTPQAQARAAEMARGYAVEVEHWPIADPTLGQGSREQRLQLYRQVRDELDQRIARRFLASDEAGGSAA